MEGMASVPVDELIKMSDAMRAMEKNKIAIHSPGSWCIDSAIVRYVGKDEAICEMQRVIDRQREAFNNKVNDRHNYDSSFRSRLHFLFTGRLE